MKKPLVVAKITKKGNLHITRIVEKEPVELKCPYNNLAVPCNIYCVKFQLSLSRFEHQAGIEVKPAVNACGTFHVVDKVIDEREGAENLETVFRPYEAPKQSELVVPGSGIKIPR